MKVLNTFLITLLSFSLISSFANADDKKQEKSQSKRTYQVAVPDEMPKCNLEELQKRIVYPESARKNGIEGKVFVKVLVDTDGKVIKTKVVSSDSKKLNKAARDAIAKTKFEPAMKNGKPLRAWVVLPIQFKLH